MKQTYLEVQDNFWRGADSLEFLLRLCKMAVSFSVFAFYKKSNRRRFLYEASCRNVWSVTGIDIFTLRRKIKKCISMTRINREAPLKILHLIQDRKFAFAVQIVTYSVTLLFLFSQLSSLSKVASKIVLSRQVDIVRGPCPLNRRLFAHQGCH